MYSLNMRNMHAGRVPFLGDQKQKAAEIMSKAANWLTTDSTSVCLQIAMFVDLTVTLNEKAVREPVCRTTYLSIYI